ncbi:MAG: methyltransferase domain-containing protein [Bryobacteraceae bacterium]
MRRIALISVLLASVAFGQQPRLASKLAPYVASPSRVVEMMLEMARLKPGEVLFDLGSGDGRILVAAAERRAQATGVEINPKLVIAATEEIARAGLSERAKVIQGDVMQTDFSAANVVTIYMDTASNAKLRPQLEKYLKPGSRVVSHDYEIPGWKPVLVQKTDERQPHTIYLYEIGAKK